MDDQQLPGLYNPLTINHSWNDSIAVADVGVASPADMNATSEGDKACVLASRFYIQAILAGVLCITGIVTNGFSIAVLSRDRETSQISSLLLRSLAFADIFFLSSWLIAWTLPSAFNYSANTLYFHVAYHYLRIYSYPLLFVGQTAAIWTTVLIAASRFIAVSLPYHAPTFCTLRGTRFRLAGVVVFSVAYNIPRFFELRILSAVTPGQRPWNLTDFGASYAYRTVYFDICYYVFSFFLPLVLLTTFNLRLIADYRRINRKRSAMLTSGRTPGREKHEQNITLVMIIVIVVFVLCNTPARILQVVTSSYSPQPCPSKLFFLLEFSCILEVLNSNLNFFVYFIFRKQFRQILQRELCAASSAHTTATLTQPPQQSMVAPPVAAPNGHTQLQDPCYKSITA